MPVVGPKILYPFGGRCALRRSTLRLSGPATAAQQTGPVRSWQASPLSQACSRRSGLRCRSVPRGPWTWLAAIASCSSVVRQWQGTGSRRRCSTANLASSRGGTTRRAATRSHWSWVPWCASTPRGFEGSRMQSSLPPARLGSSARSRVRRSSRVGSGCSGRCRRLRGTSTDSRFVSCGSLCSSPCCVATELTDAGTSTSLPRWRRPVRRRKAPSGPGS
mmetsp:Transcript_117794/g.375541  ORF Transcript_117794/g.375541 Transcript_117794/m.375541 type:complete len:219 (+) Transcript_117794:2273-2929(+)